MQLPRKCRVFCAIDPSNQWGWDEVFNNKTVYLLELLLWQGATPSKKKDMPKHKAAKPKQFIPDFMKKPSLDLPINEGVGVMTVDDVKSWLAVPRGV